MQERACRQELVDVGLRIVGKVAKLRLPHCEYLPLQGFVLGGKPQQDELSDQGAGHRLLCTHVCGIACLWSAVSRRGTVLSIPQCSVFTVSA